MSTLNPPRAAGSTRSATAYPFPVSLPLYTHPAPPPNRPSPPPSSSPLGARSSPPVELPSTMPPSGLGVVILPTHSASVPSVFSPLDSPKSTTTAGTSLQPSSASGSDSDSPSPSWSTTTPSAPNTSGFTSVSMSPPPSPTTSPPATDSASLSFLSPPVLTSFQPSSTSATQSPSATPDSTTLMLSTTLVTSDSPSSLNTPSTSTFMITYFVPGQVGTTTEFVTSSNVLSTVPPGRSVNSTPPLSPGTIAAIVLGIFGAIAFSALWLFCARRRHRKLVRQTPLILPEHHHHHPGPLDDEILHAEELGYATGSNHSGEVSPNPTMTMEERYAGILAALHSTGFGRGNEGGSTGGIYGSRHGTGTDVDGDTRASSPTLPLHVLPPDDPPYVVALSPPPPVSHQQLQYQVTQPVPPPSSYHLAPRRKSSPGPDVATLLGGYSLSPSSSSYYARSQTLGSGSGSGSVDALTRTRTGSEEPLLGIGKTTTEMSAIGPTTMTDTGANRPGLGSAFGSPPGSMHSPSGAYPALYDTSGSYGTRSASGSGSYGYAHSGAPSSFDILRRVSSQGGLSSAYNQDHGQTQGFRFGFRQGSASSGSTGKKTGSNRHSFGVPPSSFKARKDRGSAASDKEKQSEKQSLREKQRPLSRTSSASASGSADEKQGGASPVAGVRAFLGRLRRAGHTPSPRSSNKDLSSPTKTSMDADSEKAAADRATPPPIEIEAATPQRRRFSFILSNPDSNPPSPYSGAGMMPSSGTPPRSELCPVRNNAPASETKPVPFGVGGLQPAVPFPAGFVLAPAPSPAPTEESRLPEGLLHPRLRTQGDGDASLRDFEDYSRPIGGVVKNRLYSTTTFGTQDENEKSASTSAGGTPEKDVLLVKEQECEDDDDVTDGFGSILRSVPQDSWFGDDLLPPRHSPRATP